MFSNLKKTPLFAVLLALLFIALTAFVSVLTAKGIAEFQQVGHAPRAQDTFTIDGEGKVTGTPDLARVDIGLYTEGDDVPSAQNANTQKVNAMLAALKDLGIDQADIQTSNYTITPRYQYNEGAQTVIGYAVSQNLSAKVRDLSKIGTVLARVGSLGANQVNGVTFTVDDPTSLEQAARKKALEDARKKAEELADALGVKIVRVVTFSESSGNLPTPQPIALRGLEAAPAGQVIPEIQPGSLDIQSQVSVTFEIR